MNREYVLASGNQGKLREISAMLKPLGLSVRPQSVWQISEAEETASTFVENSLIKARHAARHAGLPCIADDSGLVVPVLNGEPGIYSARYGGDNSDDQGNIRKLLGELKGKHGSERHAYFYCALVLLNSADDPAPLIATGYWHGLILETPRGDGGFGYDPVFGVSRQSNPGRQYSAAELSAIEKGRLSHRGQALNELVRQLRERDGGITE
jgi:XTP/dITP diphosphohydrolase